MRAARIVRAFLFAASLALAAASSAHAAIALKGHYEDFGGATCYNASVCRVSFDAVPAGKTVVISHVSCRVEIASSSSIILREVVLQVVTAGGTDLFRDHFLTPVLLGSVGTARYYQINNDALHIYNNRRVPRIELGLGGNPAFGITIACQIGGAIE